MKRYTLGRLVLALALLLFAPALRATPAAAEENQPGGRFILMTQDEKIVTDQDFRDRFMLIFFGYTFCPDICPTSMMEVTEVMNMLGNDGNDVQPLFISVDPERDTPAVLREYISHFHEKIIGLTGTKEAVESVTGKYRVKYARKPDDKDPSSYAMDHTAALFLMGPEGEFIARFPYGTKADVIAEEIRQKKLALGRY